MIKRLSKHNDYKDIIKSCPSGVIDDIYAIEYYIQGHNETIQASFTKTGDVLEAILPSSDLETLPNGILMRRAFYKVLDASYPDGYYNLEFEDNLNVWLGEVESEEPVIPEYITEEELAETLEDYATTEDVTTAVSDLGGRISALENAGYITSAALSGYATEQWVGQQGYITSSALSGYATQSWVQNQDYALDSDLDSLETRVSVLEHGGSPVTLAWGGISGTITDQTDLVSYVSTRLSVYATQNWVYSQIDGLASEDWVSQVALEGYATEQWVDDQGYITSSALSGYATESWATNQFLEESKVWTGTQTQWNQLTAEQKASYTIALITQ